MKKDKRPQPDPAPAAAPASPDSSSWMVWVGAVAFAFVLLQVYAPALRGPFLFDDLRLPFTRSFELAVPWTFYLKSVRPLLNVIFWWEGRTWGMNPQPYHFFNVVFHFFNGLLVWFIIRRLLLLRGTAMAAASLTAAFCAGVFLFHPLQTEAVSYIASRSENLSVFFAYAAIGVFLARSDREISWGSILKVCALIALGLTTKEHVVVVPAVLLLCDYWFNPGFSVAGIRANWRLYGLFVLGGFAAASFLAPILFRAETAGFGLKDFTWYEYFFTQCRALWIYLRMFIVPYGLNLDHGFPVSKSIMDHGAVFGLLGLLAAVAAAWIYRKRFPLASLGLLVFLLMIAPTSSFVPIQDTLVERRVYFPMIGLVLILAEFVSRWRPDAGRAALLVVILAALGVLTWQRNVVYSSSIAMWEDSIKGNPGNARAQFQLGYAYYQASRCREAIDAYGRAAALKPPDYNLLVDWALAYECDGRFEPALQKVDAALQLENNPHAWSVKGMILGKQNRADLALSALDTALSLDPTYETALVYRGNVLYQSSEPAKAIEAFQRALSLNPQNEAARQGLAAAQRALRNAAAPNRR